MPVNAASSCPAHPRRSQTIDTPAERVFGCNPNICLQKSLGLMDCFKLNGSESNIFAQLIGGHVTVFDGSFARGFVLIYLFLGCWIMIVLSSTQWPAHTSHSDVLRLSSLTSMQCNFFVLKHFHNIV